MSPRVLGVDVPPVALPSPPPRHETPAARDDRARTEAENALGWLDRIEKKFDALAVAVAEVKLDLVTVKADVAIVKEAKRQHTEHKIAKWGAAGGIAGAIGVVIAAWLSRGSQPASAAPVAPMPTVQQSTSATFQAGKLEGYRAALQEFAAAAQANPPALSASLRVVARAPQLDTGR